MEEFILKSRYDDLDISVLIVRPETEVKAILQLSHGMSGWKERFLPFMKYMADQGILCIANDHRGHGASVKEDKDIGYMYKGGAKALVNDMRLVSEMICKQYPDTPLFLLGHSMGSMAARAYTIEDDSLLKGLIVCGTPSYSIFAPIVYALCSIACKLGLGRVRANIAHQIVSYFYNIKFASEGPQAWTCSDPEVRKEYGLNPDTKYRFSLNAAKGLMWLMMSAYGKYPGQNCSKNLPIIFLSGEDDPCGKMPKGMNKAIKAMKKLGYSNIDFKTYPKMRHEILNEIDKEKVWYDIFSFIKNNI